VDLGPSRRAVTFVTNGVRAAVEQATAIAGERNIAVTAGMIARQCLELGLLDEVAVDLVPVVMGDGRPFFGTLSIGDVKLDNLTACVASERVTHLRFPTKR
jgi:dihydrofolate reductase